MDFNAFAACVAAIPLNSQIMQKLTPIHVLAGQARVL